MTKKYDEIDVTAWNTRHFTDYLKAEHKRLYNVDYTPFRGYNAEAGILGRYIGTAKKPGLYDKALVKAFIDVCFSEYKPSAQWPGLSFGFMSTYMTRNLQRLQAEEARALKASDAVNASDNDKLDELEAWL